MFVYKTNHGTFKIVANSIGRYILMIDEKKLRTYNSPEEAADDVYMQATGYDKWDKQEGITEPYDLSDWKQM